MRLKPWYTVVEPREDLREGKPLDASEFAVHLGQVRDGRAQEDYRIVEAMQATLLQVFSSTYVIDVHGSLNAVVVATVRPSEAENLQANLSNLEEYPFLRATTNRAIRNLHAIEPGPVVFTDDRAAIELMTNALVIEFALKMLR